MAVSQQWFIQWSTPSMVFTDISKQYDRGHSRWDDDFPSVKSNDGYNRDEYGPTRRPAAVYENDYEIEYEEEPKYQDRTKAAGITLWLAMMGLTRPQVLPADVDTPPFNTLYKWKEIDFEFPSPKHRKLALLTGKYIPENVLPLGLEVWGSRVFVTLPSWRRGVPATLATVSRIGGTGTHSPKLEPYPNWSYHRAFNNSQGCLGITSVFRINADPCGRLWVLDSGQIDSQDNPKQLCPPSILVFDLTTDELIARYEIPKKYVKENSLFANIIIDSRDSKECRDLYAYIADTWRFGLLVFRERDAHFWRYSHPYFYPDPLASNFTVHGTNFQWTDGIFGLALTQTHALKQDRLLFFHPMSSFREFQISTKILRNYERVNNSAHDFYLVGDSRGPYGQVSASYIDRRGIMFFGLVTQDSIGCWNTKNFYRKENLAIVARNSETLIFPNDIKVDQDEIQSVWVLSNRLPLYQAGELNNGDYNYRIMYASTEDAVRGTVCDMITRSSEDFLKKWFH